MSADVALLVGYAMILVAIICTSPVVAVALLNRWRSRWILLAAQVTWPFLAWLLVWQWWVEAR